MTRCRIRVTREVGERATFTFTVPGGQGPSLTWFRAGGVPRPTSSVRMRHPAGPTTARSPFPRWRAGAVLDEVFRRLLVSGQRLDHVEIACATDADAVLAWEKAQRRGWPVTLEAGMSVAQTRPAIERPRGGKRSPAVECGISF